MNNHDPWHMLENVSEKELQEFCNKQASKSGQHHQRPLREGFVFLISYYEAIKLMPQRLRFRTLGPVRLRLLRRTATREYAVTHHAILCWMETTA